MNPEAQATIFCQQDLLSASSTSGGTQKEANGILDQGRHSESAGLLGLPVAHALCMCIHALCIQPSSQLCTLKSSHFINEKLFVTLLILINMPCNADLAIDI